MAEAGLVTISKTTACARLAQELAREVIRSGTDPLQFTRELKQLWIAADYPSTLENLGYLDEEVYVGEYCGQTVSETREMVRKRFAEFAEYRTCRNCRVPGAPISILRCGHRPKGDNTSRYNRNRRFYG